MRKNEADQWKFLLNRLAAHCALAACLACGSSNPRCRLRVCHASCMPISVVGVRGVGGVGCVRGVGGVGCVGCGCGVRGVCGVGCVRGARGARGRLKRQKNNQPPRRRLVSFGELVERRRLHGSSGLSGRFSNPADVFSVLRSVHFFRLLGRVQARSSFTANWDDSRSAEDFVVRLWACCRSRLHLLLAIFFCPLVGLV